MTNDELVAYYQNLLIIQYKTMPKAIATVGAVVTPIIADQILAQVRDGFDLATAIGKQLDILGQYVGAQRVLPGYTPAGDYMAFPDYADAGAGAYVGFSDYADTSVPTGYWRLYTTTDVQMTMSDGELRELIQYLIAVHASDHSNADIDAIFARFFGGFATVTDGEDMTVTYTHDHLDPFTLFDIVHFIGALPHPAGVSVVVTII